MLLNKDEILRALKRLGELAHKRGDHLSFLVLGGSAMVLQYGARQATQDIDVVALPGNAPEWRSLAAKVAEEFDWPQDWLNDGAKGFVHGEIASSSQLEYDGLHLTFPEPEQLLAMKLMAWRDDRDIDDAMTILKSISKRSKEEIWERLQAYVVPGVELKVQYAFEDLWEAQHD